MPQSFDPNWPERPQSPSRRELPAGWQPISIKEQAGLAAAFAKELDAKHPLARADWRLIAHHVTQDSFVAEAPALTPRFYLLHLAWDQGGPKQPHALEKLGDLAGILEPPGDTVDELSLWCRARDEQGLVFVEHLLDGSQRLHLLDWPPHQGEPRDCRQLEAWGWRPITGALSPKAERDGSLCATGQRVEYWLRPVIDDFMLFRAIESPGEALSLKKLMPDDGLIVEFDDQAALERALPPDFYCRFVTPQAVGFGRSALPPARPSKRARSTEHAGWLERLRKALGR